MKLFEKDSEDCGEAIKGKFREAIKEVEEYMKSFSSYDLSVWLRKEGVEIREANYSESEILMTYSELAEDLIDICPERIPGVIEGLKELVSRLEEYENAAEIKDR